MCADLVSFLFIPFLYSLFLIHRILNLLTLLYGDDECAQQPCPHSPTGDLGEIAGVNGQNSEGMCQGGKLGTGKLYTYMLLRPHQWVRGRWPWGYGGVLSIIHCVLPIYPHTF